MKPSIIHVAIATGAAAGCAPTSSRLEPDTAAARSQARLVQLDQDTIVDRQRQITVTAEVDAWPGDPQVLEHVTPIRVTLRNNGDRPVRVQYKQFQLVTAGDDRHRALPPFAIEGTIRDPVIVSGGGIARPSLYYPGFRVDPMYADVWPTLDTYGPLYDHDPYFYQSTYAYWRRPLPTPDMRSRVLPEGVLEPGGRVSGFLYFEKLDDDVNRARLVTRLVDARDGGQIATSRIPFTVDEG